MHNQYWKTATQFQGRIFKSAFSFIYRGHIAFLPFSFSFFFLFTLWTCHGNLRYLHKVWAAIWASFFCFFILVSWDKFSVCNPGWPLTHYVAQCDIKFTAILLPQPSSIVIIGVWQYYSQLHLCLKINKITGILYSIGLGHYFWFNEYHFFRIRKPHRETWVFCMLAMLLELFFTWLNMAHG